MFLRALLPWLRTPQLFFEGTGAGGAGGGGTGGNVDPFAAITSLDQVPGRIKEMFNGIIAGRINEARTQWQNENGGQPLTAQERQRLKDLEAEETKRTQKALEEKGEYERVLKSKDEAFEGERKGFGEKITKLTDRLRNVTITNKLLEAAKDSVNPRQLAKLLSDRVRLTDDYDVEVLDENGHRALKAGQPLTVDELVTQYLDENPHLRKPAGTGGSGSPGGQSTGSESAGAGSEQNAELAALQKAMEDAAKEAKEHPSAAAATAAHKAKRAYETAKRKADKK